MDTKKLDPNYVELPVTVKAGEAVGTVASGAKNGVIKLGVTMKPFADKATRVFRNFGRGVKRGWSR